MSGDGQDKSGSGRSRRLSEDDARLWRGVANSVEPLRRRWRRVPNEAERLAEARIEADPAQTRAADPASGRAAAPVRAAAPPGGTPAVPPLNEFDRRKARRLADGRHEIEARIDLHGMRQAAAHSALRSFLFDCYGRGLRMVLVITGKGGERHVKPGDDYGWANARGVLKREVPRWLAEPELRALVVSHTTAHVRHGGGGALYIQLRRASRPVRS